MLLVAANGTTGSTHEEIKRLLGLSPYQTVDHLNSVDVQASLPFTFANAVFFKQGLQPSQKFSNTFQQYFKGEVKASNSEKEINQWCKQTTGTAASAAVGEIDSSSSLILANVTHIKPMWKYSFKVANTKPGTFQSTTQFGTHPCTMMTLQTRDHVSCKLKYLAKAKSKTVVLPLHSTTQAEIEAVVILPETNMFSNNDLKSCLAEVQNATAVDGTVVLPKSKMMSGSNVKNAFCNLGIKALVEASNDFQAMFDGSPPILGTKMDFVYQTLIDVSEGETANNNSRQSTVSNSWFSGYHVPTFQMCCNKPFYLVIREKTSGLIVFLGYIQEPKIMDITQVPSAGSVSNSTSVCNSFPTFGQATNHFSTTQNSFFTSSPTQATQVPSFSFQQQRLDTLNTSSPSITHNQPNPFSPQVSSTAALPSFSTVGQTDSSIQAAKPDTPIEDLVAKSLLPLDCSTLNTILNERGLKLLITGSKKLQDLTGVPDNGTLLDIENDLHGAFQVFQFVSAQWLQVTGEASMYAFYNLACIHALALEILVCSKLKRIVKAGAFQEALTQIQQFPPDLKPLHNSIPPRMEQAPTLGGVVTERLRVAKQCLAVAQAAGFGDANTWKSDRDLLSVQEFI